MELLQDKHIRDVFVAVKHATITKVQGGTLPDSLIDISDVDNINRLLRNIPIKNCVCNVLIEATASRADKEIIKEKLTLALRYIITSLESCIEYSYEIVASKALVKEVNKKIN
jgi:hypothetical protein